MSARIPRLEMDDLDPELAAALRPRVERLGYLGEFFKVMGHQAKALLGFITFTEEAKKALPDNIVETIALTASTCLDNAYERNQHERLSVRLGLGRGWIAAIERLEPGEVSTLSREERVVQAYVLAALQSHGRAASAVFEEVIDVLGPDAAVAVTAVLGRYATHAIIVNTFGLTAPVPSIFEDGFGENAGG